MPSYPALPVGVVSLFLVVAVESLLSGASRAAPDVVSIGREGSQVAPPAVELGDLKPDRGRELRFVNTRKEEAQTCSKRKYFFVLFRQFIPGKELVDLSTKYQ